MFPRGLLLLWATWSSGAVLFGGSGPSLIRWMALGGVVVGLGLALWKQKIQALWSGLAAFCLLTTFAFLSLQPQANRDWASDQARMPRVIFDGSSVTIEDYRTFRYRSASDWEARWTAETFDLDTLVGADLGVEQFSSIEAIAHTFVSFRFADGRVLVASVEIRKERGETFSPLKGLYRQYEKMIVLGDERDLVELRAVHRNDTVYLHPLEVSVDQVRVFLESVLTEASELERRPAFYNTLTASCSSTLSWHLMSMGALGYDYRMFLPGYVDVLAWELGWLGDGELEALREAHRIDDRARAAAGAADFSAQIRGEVGSGAPIVGRGPAPSIDSWRQALRGLIREEPLMNELSGMEVGKTLRFASPVRVGERVFEPELAFIDDEGGYVGGELAEPMDVFGRVIPAGTYATVWLNGQLRGASVGEEAVQVGTARCHRLVTLHPNGALAACTLAKALLVEGLDFAAEDELVFDPEGSVTEAYLYGDRAFAMDGWVKLDHGEVVDRLLGYHGD